MQNNVIVFDLISLVFLLIIGLSVIYKPHWVTKYYKWFLYQVIVLFIASAVNAFNGFYVDSTYPNREVIYKLLTITYGILITSFSYIHMGLFAHYFLDKWFIKRLKYFIIFGFSLCLIIGVIAFFSNSLVVYTDTSRSASSLYYVYSVPYIIFSSLSLYIFIKNSKKLTKINYISIATYIFCTIISMIYLSIYPKISIFHFFITIYVILVYISFFSTESYLETGIPIFNYEAYKKRIYYNSKYDIKDRSYYIFELINLNTFDEEISLDIKSLVAHKLTSIFKQNVYLISNTRFAVESKDDYLDIIKEEFINSPLKLKNEKIDFTIRPLIGYFKVPGDFIYPSDITNASKDINYIKRYDYENISHISSQNIKRLKSALEIESILMGYLEEKTFDLTYRPVYNVKTGTYNGLTTNIISNDANYCIPLKDMYEISTLGGFLAEVENTMIISVAKFIEFHDLDSLGIEHIFVYINSTTLSDKNRYETLTSLYKRNTRKNINYLTFLINEVPGFNNPININENILGLKNLGIRVYLDGYGSGYSTLQYIFSFPFDGVKISSLATNLAVEEKKRFFILKYLLSVALEAKKDIFLSGYDNKETEKIVDQFKLNYLTGDSLSSYLNGEESIEFFIKKNGNK